ncbi:MAG: hypothetical protein NVSMB12_21950 [Acidimicrobiales bacterium]
MFALVCMTVAIAPAARAGTPAETTYTGWIKLAHGAFNAVTEVGAPCDPTSPLNGLDGVWYKLPRGSTHVTLTPSAILDADVVFRAGPGGRLGCHGVPGEGGFLPGRGYGHAVSGSVPSEATFLLVNGFLGTGAFSIRFSRGPVEAFGPFSTGKQCPFLPLLPNSGWNCLPVTP